MIVCPACRHKELFGTLFCSECGAQLVQQGSLEPERSPNGSPNPPGSNSQGSGAVLCLHLVDCDRKLVLRGREEYTLGRAYENQPVLPDVDLSPYQAYEAGVSRLHATIQVKEQRAWVIDLGSSNGTRVNGKRIASHTPSPLEAGDVLMLGALRIQVFPDFGSLTDT